MRHFERLTESKLLPKWLIYEHEARYAFCRERVSGKRVLDCGSGEGRGTRAIAAGKPRLIVAIDRAVGAVALARSDHLRALVGDAECLPVRSASADVIIALEVIEHFNDPAAFLREVSRVLGHDGMFICSTPNRTVRNPRLPLSGKPLNPWHLREWTPAEFQELLSEQFDRVDMFGQQAQSSATTRLFERFGRISYKAAAILRQLVKIRFLVHDSPAAYRLQPLRPDIDFEFLLSVCSKPFRE